MATLQRKPERYMPFAPLLPQVKPPKGEDNEGRIKIDIAKLSGNRNPHPEKECGSNGPKLVFGAGHVAR